MNQKHNSIIKFDLHIHSKASAYKEKGGIVDSSTIENIPLLLSKLDEYKIALFSITDHNRFDIELYQKITMTLSQPDCIYTHVKTILPGIEFDVKIDDEMDKCHIIAIFNARNEKEKLEQIENALKSNLLTKDDEYYNKKEFEDILYNIGLDTILIASQHKDLYNHSGKHNSLSDSTNNVEEIIRIGYIDALEFQKPKVEGILINNLRNLSLPISLLSGSDCHDWNYYPYHSRLLQNAFFSHSKAKILPTFKGLLMAVTSPETRFNCRENSNQHFLSGFSLRGQNVNFVNGINAIIGENGSGKTTLLELINNRKIAKHIIEIIKENELLAKPIDNPTRIKYIEQGQIINKFNKMALFSSDEENNFKELNNEYFINVYTDYSSKLLNCIKHSIKKTQDIANLSKQSIDYTEDIDRSSYYINVTISSDFPNVENPHDFPLSDINKMIDNIESLLDQVYFQKYENKLKIILTELKNIQSEIYTKWEYLQNESQVKNILYSCIQEYLRRVKNSSNSIDQELLDIKIKRQNFIDSIIESIKHLSEDIAWPEEPKIIEGISKNQKKGFNFIRQAEYNNVTMINNFYSKMFIKKYSNISAVQGIKSWSDFEDAVMQCTTTSDIFEKWNGNFTKFINESTKTTEFITDAMEQKIGNTLGEMSLSYYKYFTEDNDEWNMLIIDQPEDNISNNNVKSKLISYLDDIRNKKQLIFVTHNPLLVVNLDVDNVIFISNDNGKLSITDGCLEYESDKINILELIADNMDGGKETIEKRLKVYGKKY